MNSAGSVEALRVVLRDLIADVIGVAAHEVPCVHDEMLLAYDLGLESIELVALLARMRTDMGVKIETLGALGLDPAQVFDRLSVRWVIDQARRGGT